ncbi:unnamed protein product [Pylaiella littoralis]
MNNTRLHCILSVEEISRLISIGADVNHQDCDGGTALHVSRSSAVVRTLVEHGACVHRKNNRGMSPLHRARNVGVAAALLEHGAPVNSLDNHENTPLHYANDAQVVRVLLMHGGNPGARNSAGETPIHRSIYLSKVLALVNAGADVDAADNEGRTLLMRQSRCFFVTNMLRGITALYPSDRVRDAGGRTAVDFAEWDGVKHFLLEYRKRHNWFRRRGLVILREKNKHGVKAVGDTVVCRVLCVPEGVFRSIVGYL